MELDTHCLKILGRLSSGELSFEEADRQMSIHGDELLADVLKNGFTTYYSKDDMAGWVGSKGE